MMSGAVAVLPPLPRLTPAAVGADVQALVDVAGTAGDARPLRDAYFDALRRAQGYDFPSAAGGPVVETAFADPARRRIAARILEQDDVPAERLFGGQEAETVRARTHEARALLRGFSPEAAEVVDLLTACVAFVKREGVSSGSMPALLGVVMLHPSPSWDAVEYAAAMLHEGVHQSLFLHDMVRGLYVTTGAALEDAEHVTASISRRTRGYEPSFHAAYVALALVELYRAYDRPEKATRLLEGVAESLPQLAARAELLADPGRAVLRDMTERLELLRR